MPPKRPPPPEVLARPSAPWPKSKPPPPPSAAPSDQVRELWEELNFTSAAKLKTALKQRGIPYNAKDVDNMVKRSEARQLLPKKHPYKGKIWSTSPNDRWQADLIDYTARPSSKGDTKYTHILAVMDIFTRRLFTRPLTGTKPKEVVEAFKEIVAEHGHPRELNTDKGQEFTDATFEKYLEDNSIPHRVKDPKDLNDIATLDRAIATLRRSLFQTGTAGTWASRLERVTAGYNKTPHPATENVAPKDVEGNDDVTFRLKHKAANDLEHNQIQVDKRGKKLIVEGAFRTLDKQEKFNRTFKPQYSKELHFVDKVEGGAVTDKKGKTYPTKQTFAVPKETEPSSNTGEEDAFTRRGSAQTEDKRRRILQKFADGIKKVIREAGGEVTLTKVALNLPKLGDFKSASLEAGISQKRVTAAFLETFPQLFSVHTPAKGGSAVARLK